MFTGNTEVCEVSNIQRICYIQTARNKTDTTFDCDLENLDRKKIPVSKWLVRLRAEEGIMRSSGWVLKTENLSKEK